MYRQTQINHKQVNKQLEEHIFCLNAYNAMTKKSREELLKKHGHSKVYASRSYNYLFKNIRDDLKPSLLMRG